MQSWSHRAVRVLGSGLVGLGGIAAAHGGEPRTSLLPNVQQEVLSTQARALATRPFMVQAANGAVLDQTIWEYHFALRATDELHASGMAHLDRLARRQLDSCPGTILHIYLQRSQEHYPTQMARRRMETDKDRHKAITAYLKEAWPDMPFNIEFCDPHSVGMPAREAGPALVRHQGTALGYIPEGFRAVQTSSKTDGTGSAPAGGFFKPEPPSEPGVGGPSSLGISTSISPSPSDAGSGGPGGP